MSFSYVGIILSEIMLKSHCTLQHFSLEIISIGPIHHFKQFMLRGSRLRIQSKQPLNISSGNRIRNL